MQQITILNMDKYTPQQVFDFVAAHLLHQFKRSVIELRYSTFVRRKNPDGLTCAIGCLMPPGVYESRFEGLTYREITLLPGAPKTLFSHIGLLEDLEVVHDMSEPKEWKDRLGAVAARHNLGFSQN